MKDELTCYNCIHLFITELEQDMIYKRFQMRVPHTCLVYDTVVNHKMIHPHIPRLDECNKHNSRETI